MVGSRLLLTYALLFGFIISNTFGASLKAYDPYGTKKRLTTTTPSTSTTPLTTTTIPEITTTTTIDLKEAEVEDEKENDETENGMIRKCTCAESDECINQAWSKISTCQEECKEKLEFFGDDVDAGLKCFDNDKNGGTLINNCFKTIKGYCTKSSDTTPEYIEKPKYEPLSDKFKIKEHEIVEAFKAFHICSAGECMKDMIIKCFKEKQCGVSLGENHDIGKIGDFCPTLKGSIYVTSTKALPCLMPGLKRRQTKRQQQ
jgi:hypothetical protein